MVEALPIETKPADASPPARSQGCCGSTSAEGDAPWLEAWLAGICALATLLGWLLPGWVASDWLGGWTPGVLFGIAYLAGGAMPTLGAWRQAWQGEIGVDLLMIVAALGAAAIGEPFEGAILLFLFSTSHVLERFALDSARRAIDALVELRPAEASVIGDDGQERRVPIEALQLGDRVRVRPGERVAIDGVVAEGETWIDESTLTGESEPVNKQAGANIFAGTLNGAGSIVARTTALAADTTLERIIALVREAQSSRPPVQQFVERWQGTYVISVLALATVVFFATWAFHAPDNIHDAFYHAMVLLVAASPCAVVASVPAVMLSAIARGALGGMLCKGGVHLETLGEVDAIAVDKTGTLTTGHLSVAEIWTPPGASHDHLLAVAAAVEMSSEHPLASAVVAAARTRQLDLPAASDFASQTGQGVVATVAGRRVAVGREALLRSLGMELSPEAVAAIARLRGEGSTVLIVAETPTAEAPGVPLIGAIAVKDTIRPSAKQALAALRQLGVRKIVVLTGDHQQVAEQVAREVDADEVQAGLMPGEKLDTIRRLREEGATVAMVGDGVNDAPALAAASVGIAMGGRGTDVALETADIVLMRDDLLQIPFAVWLGRRAVLGVRQNLVLSLGVVAGLVIGSIFGLPLWLSVLCHEGSTLLVVLNGVRILAESPRQ